MGLAVWVAPVGAASLSMRTDRLIERLEGLGMAIDRLERCGPGLERAACNMGINRLCLVVLRPSDLIAGLCVGKGGNSSCHS